jgi:hypothetical protein
MQPGKISAPGDDKCKHARGSRNHCISLPIYVRTGPVTRMVQAIKDAQLGVPIPHCGKSRPMSFAAR